MFSEITVFDRGAHDSAYMIARLENSDLVPLFSKGVGRTETTDPSTENGNVLAQNLLGLQCYRINKLEEWSTGSREREA